MLLYVYVQENRSWTQEMEFELNWPSDWSMIMFDKSWKPSMDRPLDREKDQKVGTFNLWVVWQAMESVHNPSYL